MTFKQAIELGGHVRKGEKGSPVVYADTMRRTDTDDATGDETERAIPFLKAYTVFNVEQIEGLPEHFHALAHASRNPDERIAGAEAFSRASGHAHHRPDRTPNSSVASDRRWQRTGHGRGRRSCSGFTGLLSLRLRRNLREAVC
jgi:antirestriction protein ArdC